MSKEQLLFCPLGGSGEIGMNSTMTSHALGPMVKLREHRKIIAMPSQRLQQLRKLVVPPCLPRKKELRHEAQSSTHAYHAHRYRSRTGHGSQRHRIEKRQRKRRSRNASKKGSSIKWFGVRIHKQMD